MASRFALGDRALVCAEAGQAKLRAAAVAEPAMNSRRLMCPREDHALRDAYSLASCDGAAKGHRASPAAAQAVKLGPIGDRRVRAGLPFVREVDFCATNQWPQRIATQIATHRLDRIDLYRLFVPALSPRNGFTAYTCSPRGAAVLAPVVSGKYPANVAPGSRRQDHTTSPYAANVSSGRNDPAYASCVHRLPCPT